MPESLANSERHLDIAKANSQRAEDKAEELRKLNRSIFRPAIVWNKVSLGWSAGVSNARTTSTSLLPQLY